MNSSQLLNRTLANRLVCQTQQIAIGPTGPTGSAGPPVPIPGALKAFTIFLDYNTANEISRVYVPPGLFSAAAASGLADGGVFTTNQGTDLVFLSSSGVGLSTLQINNTKYAFCVGISLSGYLIAGEWVPVPGGNIGGTLISYSQPNDYGLLLKRLNLGRINGSNLNKPAAGIAAGFLATVTLFYV